MTKIKRLGNLLNAMDDQQPKEPALSAADDFLNLETLIRNYVAQISQIKENLKKQKDLHADSFQSDAVYKQHEEKAKEAAKVKSETKREILKQPALAAIAEKIADFRTEIKELEDTLSDYLVQYQKQTGFNEIDLGDGETMIIVQTAKLVKGSSR